MSSFFPVKTLWRSFVCAMFGLVTLQLVDPYRGKRVLFQTGTGWDQAGFLSGDSDYTSISIQGGWGMWELWIFTLLGIFGGVFGVIFVRVNLRLQAWRDGIYARVTAPPRQHPMADLDQVESTNLYDRFLPESASRLFSQASSSRVALALSAGWTRLKNNPIYLPIVEIAIIAFVTSSISYLFIFTRISDLWVLEAFFQECDAGSRKALWGLCTAQSNVEAQVLIVLVMTMLIKSVAVTVTYGARVPGGVFIPSMMVGASFGRILSILTLWFQRADANGWVKNGWCKPDEVGVSGSDGCVKAGAWAVLGAVACWGGVTRLTGKF
jgi:chloride channel 3/4/5